MSSIPFHKPHISSEEVAAVVEALESCWLTSGPRVKQFEANFAEAVGAKYALAVNSCTAGLHLSLEAIGAGRDDAIITTPMTFAATAEVIRYFDATPFFIDIDPETLNMDAAGLQSAIAGCVAAGLQPKAIIPVHYAGQPCRMDEIMAVAGSNGLKVIEDAAHAFPASYKGKKVGSIGDVTSFSFYATKTITTGEGGMVTTGDEALAGRMKTMSLHGISADAWNRYADEGDWYYEIVAPGYKYNMNDIAASLGLVQLEKAGAFRRRREAIANKYNEALSAFEQIKTPAAAGDVEHSWHLYVIRLVLEALTIDRKQFIEELKKRGVGASVHFIPLHLQPYYRDRYGFKPGDLPVAYDSYLRIVSLPIYPGMTNLDVDRVIDVVSDTLERNTR